MQNDLFFPWWFGNISAISRWPVLVGKKPEYRERTTDHGQATGKFYHLRLWVESTLFCNLQSRARTHAVLVKGLYELLGNPTLPFKHQRLLAKYCTVNKIFSNTIPAVRNGINPCSTNTISNLKKSIEMSRKEKVNVTTIIGTCETENPQRICWGSEWLLFNSNSANFSAISWRQ